MKPSNDDSLFATHESGRGMEHYIVLVVALELMGGCGNGGRDSG